MEDEIKNNGVLKYLLLQPATDIYSPTAMVNIDYIIEKLAPHLSISIREFEQKALIFPKIDIWYIKGQTIFEINSMNGDGESVMETFRDHFLNTAVIYSKQPRFLYGMYYSKIRKIAYLNVTKIAND
ncbi:TPA: hypothetical protein HA235_07795 [Candidatus Woesearchaeota archaeon]|nr:hypothetical protein [Candidatus Woesearchaeota archaeon]HIH32581.1 hypothetical protein [Candidatus Woesearchaeota archaeon]HIH54816.1 hypothetical protein [Candidatus Woesearchaeota archaeon]HIJ02140.1 hypothetical protein [Candidatus Woesearchaeota archaeon]HIJ13654.1 hypothetical protein [Candidatus Woesearchaeota archaeon]